MQYKTRIRPYKTCIHPYKTCIRPYKTRIQPALGFTRKYTLSGRLYCNSQFSISHSQVIENVIDGHCQTVVHVIGDHPYTTATLQPASSVGDIVQNAPISPYEISNTVYPQKYKFRVYFHSKNMCRLGWPGGEVKVTKKKKF